MVLTVRFALGYGYPLVRERVVRGRSTRSRRSTTPGFALFSDNLIGFATDPWICLPIAAAVIIGGLGFPVILELMRQHRRPDGGACTPG